MAEYYINEQVSEETVFEGKEGLTKTVAVTIINVEASVLRNSENQSNVFRSKTGLKSNPR